MQFDPTTCSPFLLLVHHRHRFSKFNPVVRWASKLLLPEGFPCHPHRGFETVTICMRGGMKHRDSVGVKQHYGVGNNKAGDSQWLRAGEGIMHEEMWDGEEEQELYQIWVDSPRDEKMAEPRVECLTTKGEGTVERPWEGGADVYIGRVEVGEGETREVPVRPGHDTVIVYNRRGETLTVNGERVRTHELAILDGRMCGGVIRVGGGAGEVLVMTGKPLRQRVAMGGSFVMETEEEVETARRDFQRGTFGNTWDHEVGDEEWRRTIGR
ncbi:hypothetical protein TrCOL_g10671 [Triparma columacea]|uniref:Pirin-like protein n=1 Tax=Triparma columacea TaxID=722753 RepID=A0A9W7GBW2_9STRA|nr:hypothetical protein TrCOL_g10671 [Triparma columacea]